MVLASRHPINNIQNMVIELYNLYSVLFLHPLEKRVKIQSAAGPTN